jgi:hypothetical protein
VSGLFEITAEYCIDTNVIVSFLSDSDDEYYGSGVFSAHWDRIEGLINEGRIIAPRQVETELQRQADRIPMMPVWLKRHHHMFRDIETDQQLDFAKRLVNTHFAYARNENYLGDLEVISLAATFGLTVITLETKQQVSGHRHPKIPNVCAEFGVRCMSVVGFLREIDG